MNSEEIIEIAKCFPYASGKEDSLLVAAMVNLGYEFSVAERLTAFLPIAFGRVIISRIAELKLSNYYIIKETNQQYELMSESIYEKAFEFASEAYISGSIPREYFNAIAVRSSELDAINSALNNGANIKGAVVSPVLLFGYKNIGQKVTH